MHQRAAAICSEIRDHLVDPVRRPGQWRAPQDPCRKRHDDLVKFIRPGDEAMIRDGSGQRWRRHCHAASGLRSRWRFGSQGDEEKYRGYRFPPEIIQQAIWLYLRFTLNLRGVEDLLVERGIMVSYSY
jgi:hypothetical protein